MEGEDMFVKIMLWIVFVIFVACALYFNWHENIFHSNGSMVAGKYLIWTTFVAFLAYTVYCSWQENIFKSIKKMAELHWGRQVGIDLYLGLFLMLFIVYLNEGSVLVLLLWLVPTILFGNLATLLYLAIHFDSIVAKFLR